MVNFLNLFIIFTTLNYDGFLDTIKATNISSLKKEKKHVLTLENIQDKKCEINGKILYCSPDLISKEKYVKITEIEYDGIEIEFADKDRLPIHLSESEFHNILGGDLNPNDRGYYFTIVSIIFKITVFINEKCFHTTLSCNCPSNLIKISTSLHDQLPETIRFLVPNFAYRYIILPPNCFDDTTYSNSEYSENKNICSVNLLRPKQRRYYLYNLTITKNSNTYNINYFRFDYVDSKLYTKIYYYTSDYGMIEGHIGKNINRYNMNENILVSYTFF
ncbi:hypothetical protein SLOPH_981, partial [Spraguea lophii 42_110]